MAEFSKGSGYSKGDLIGAGTPIILYGRLYTKYETIISDVDTFVEAKDGSVYSKGGEVIVPASGETAEDIARAASVDKSGILLGGDLNVMMPNEDINSAFLAISISNGSSQRELARKAQGKSVVHIHNEEIRNLIVAFPTKAEQNKIENYFADLDHLITLHQCKCHLLLKLLYNDWEQRKLEDIMDTVTDYVAAGSFEDIRNNVTYLNEPGYAQLVRTVDLKKKFTNNDSIYVDESAFKYLWRVNLNKECIVLPNIGANIGEVYFVEPSSLPYDNNVLGPNAILLKANEDTYFAFTALNNLTFQKQLFENVGSSGQPKFNKTELKSIQLYMPQNEEQVKIGQYFRNLDHLITLHHRKYTNTLKAP